MDQYSPKTILLATDGSEDGGLAAEAAVDLSKRTGAKLHAALAWVPLPHFAHPSLVPERYHPPYEEGARRILDEQLGRIEQAGGTVSEAHLVEGRPADAILDLADRIDADLIVVGSRGLGPVKRILVGSVSLGVVHHADRPVLVAQGRSWPPVRVVIGEDLSEDARGAARLGTTLGKLLGAETILVHAYEGMPPHPETLPRDDRELYEAMVEKYLRRAEPALEARAAELEDAYRLQPRVRLLEGESARVLSDVAGEGGCSGLLVIGSRGLGAGGRMLLGSVSTKVLMAASGPVLVCPHPEPRRRQTRMNCKRRLEDHLRENEIPYRTQHHPRAITAQEVAATEHVPGRMFAKTVMVSTDRGEMCMLALPAPYHVNPEKAATALGVREARMADEERFAETFPDCEVGAMPPFGNLYGVPVYVDRTLANDETIVFRAGTHTDTMSVAYADFERLVEPTVADFTDPPSS